MRKLLILALVVLLLVSFVAVLPVSAKHGGNWEGAQGGKWSNAAPQPGWSHVNPGQGGTLPPGSGNMYLHVLGGR
jgi:hypothetical protein